MDYFGTNLTDYGHYFWKLNNDRLSRSDIKFNSLPFNPEELFDYKTKGDTRFFNIEGYSILVIAGSCKDTRWGTKSVFFLNEDLTIEQMKERILAIPVAKQMVQQMPFEVKW